MITIVSSSNINKPIVLDKEVGNLVFVIRKDGKIVARCEHPYGACKHCSLLRELKKAKVDKQYTPNEDDCPFHGDCHKKNDCFAYDPNRDGFWDCEIHEDENVFEID